MKIKVTFLALLTLVEFAAVAQKSSVIYDYYNSRIDEFVAAAGEDAAAADEVGDADPVYAKLFVSPVLYSSVVKEAFSCNEESPASESEAMALDDEREAVIDAVLMNVYRDAPEVVYMTEAQLRDVKRIPKHKEDIAGPDLQFSEVFVPQDVVGGMKTTVAKPRYWTTKGSMSLTFTQNFVSANWFQGGESAQAMLAQFDFDLNYNDKDRITFTNHFDFDLGFATSKADTLHSFRTNTDRLRLESTFGYRLIKRLDVAAKMKLETQSLPNYPVNKPDFTSNFFAPFDANFSVGFNYKPTLGKFNFEIYLAPLSAFNYKFVRFSDLAHKTYGMPDGKLYKMDYGTQLILTVPTVRIFKFIDFWARAEYYTNYSRAFFQLETKFDLALTKYFKAQLIFNTRFDDSAPGLYHSDYGFWQIKELMTLGVSYSW